MAAQTPVSGCTYHQGMGFIYICKTCNDELLCTDCVVSRHNSHTIGKLTDYVEEHEQQLRQHQKRISKKVIPKIDGQIQENEDNFKKSCLGFKTMLANIKLQGDQIKAATNNLVDNSVNLCKYLMRTNADSTLKSTAALTQIGEKLKPQLERCTQVLSSGGNADVISVALETRNTFTEIATPDAPVLKTASFQPGVVNKDLLEQMLGAVLVDGWNEFYQPVPPHTILSSFKTPFYFDVCRTGSSGSNAWLSFWDDNKIFNVDENGKINVKIECKVKIKAITVSPTTGRIWICVKEDKSIREINSKGDALTRFTVNGVPRSLCMTKEDRVVVGMYYGIVMFTSDGQAVSDGAGSDCRQEALDPNRLAYCTHTGDIAATDTDNVSLVNYIAGKELGKEPRVIVMDKHLKLKFKCTNFGAMKSQVGSGLQSKFFPMDVCFDSTGDILVVESVTKSVVLIDGNNGCFLRTVYIPRGNAPICVSLQGGHALWIGHVKDEMKIIDYS